MLNKQLFESLYYFVISNTLATQDVHKVFNLIIHRKTQKKFFNESEKLILVIDHNVGNNHLCMDALNVLHRTGIWADFNLKSCQYRTSKTCSSPLRPHFSISQLIMIYSGFNSVMVIFRFQS